MDFFFLGVQLHFTIGRIKANEKIAEKVVGSYKAIENTVVGGYRKIEDAFVDRYLTHDGESVEDAKERLHAEQAARHAQQRQDTNAVHNK